MNVNQEVMAMTMSVAQSAAVENNSTNESVGETGSFKSWVVSKIEDIKSIFSKAKEYICKKFRSIYDYCVTKIWGEKSIEPVKKMDASSNMNSQVDAEKNNALNMSASNDKNQEIKSTEGKDGLSAPINPAKTCENQTGDLPGSKAHSGLSVDFTKSVQQPASGNDFTKSDQQPASGNDFTKSDQQPASGNDFTKSDQQPASGNDFTKSVQQPAPSNQAVADEDQVNVESEDFEIINTAEIDLKESGYSFVSPFSQEDSDAGSFWNLRKPVSKSKAYWNLFKDKFKFASKKDCSSNSHETMESTNQSNLSKNDGTAAHADKGKKTFQRRADVQSAAEEVKSHDNSESEVTHNNTENSKPKVTILNSVKSFFNIAKGERSSVLKKERLENTAEASIASGNAAEPLDDQNPLMEKPDQSKGFFKKFKNVFKITGKKSFKENEELQKSDSKLNGNPPVSESNKSSAENNSGLQKEMPGCKSNEASLEEGEAKSYLISFVDEKK